MVDIYNFLNVNCFVTICSSISFDKKEALPAFAVRVLVLAVLDCWKSQAGSLAERNPEMCATDRMWKDVFYAVCVPYSDYFEKYFFIDVNPFYYMNIIALLLS